MTSGPENRTMRILGAFGVILVAAGHLNLSAFDCGGLFPYYSFHVYIFLFIAGYFYREEDEEHYGAFLLRKAKTLMLPYLIFNLLYGILATVLLGRGFAIGEKLSPYTLFVSPFLGGHQFMYHFPSWFVPALFVTEVLFLTGRILIRKSLSLIPVFRIPEGGKDAPERAKAGEAADLLLMAGSLVLGIITVYLAIGGHVWGHYKDVGRILIMLPGMAFGRTFRIFPEKHMKGGLLFEILYFALLLGIQTLLVHFCYGLNFSTVWVTSFANGPLIPFVTVCTGILFWYRIAHLAGKALDYTEEIASEPEKHTKKALFCAGCLRSVLQGFVTVGRHTFSVMMHHIFVLFLISTCCFLLHRYAGLCPGFEEDLYRSDVTYLYPYGGEGLTRFLDLVLCVGIPTALASLIRKRNKVK